MVARRSFRTMLATETRSPVQKRPPQNGLVAALPDSSELVIAPRADAVLLLLEETDDAQRKAEDQQHCEQHPPRRRYLLALQRHRRVRAHRAAEHGRRRDGHHGRIARSIAVALRRRPLLRIALLGVTMGRRRIAGWRRRPAAGRRLHLSRLRRPASRIHTQNCALTEGHDCHSCGSRHVTARRGAYSAPASWFGEVPLVTR